MRQKEALEAAQIEIKNKTETIAEFHSVIEELKNENHRLESLNSELRAHKRKMKDDLADLEKEMNCLKRGNDLLQGIAQGSLDKIVELERDRNEMVQDYESAIDEMRRINDISRVEVQSLSKELSFYKREVESFNVSLKECEVKMGMLMDDNSRLQLEMVQIKRQADEDAFNYIKENQSFHTKVETIQLELEKCLEDLKRKQDHIEALEEEVSEKQVDIDSQRDEIRDEYEQRINLLEKMIEERSMESRQDDAENSSNVRAETIAYYEKQMEKLREEHDKELSHRDQINEEKVRISEIQYEEKIKGLEMCIENEKRTWASELQQCQKIAESEIMQSEFEKRDLKAFLDSANELLREKDEKIEQLQQVIKHEEDTYTNVRSEVEAEVAELKQLNQQLLTEKHNYQLTLGSTRSTVQILMERLKKSDNDVENLKADIDLMAIDKSNMEVELNILKDQLLKVSEEKEEFKTALNILKVSAEAMQKEMREKETIFEKLMSSEEETLNTVHNLGKLFNDKVEENLSKYYEMYNDLRKKYEVRETYIKDMKTLLDEFATGIEFARLELETKDKRIVELEEENKNIKLETMTYKFRCESLEKYSHNDSKSGSVGKVPPPTPDLIEDAGNDCDTLVSTEVIQTIIHNLECSEVKENNDRQRIDLLQEIVQEENEEIKYLKTKVRLATRVVTEYSITNIFFSWVRCLQSWRKPKWTPRTHSTNTTCWLRSNHTILRTPQN